MQQRELNCWLKRIQEKRLKLSCSEWKQGEPRMNVRALQLLARIKGKERGYVEEALADNNSDIRIAGLRIARELKLDVIPNLKILVKDSSPQVRRECALTLRHNLSSGAADIWADLAAQHDGKDRWYLEALGIAADKQEDQFFDAWLKKVGDNWNTKAGRDIVWRLHAKKLRLISRNLFPTRKRPIRIAKSISAPLIL
jgi:hypothetical protein